MWGLSPQLPFFSLSFIICLYRGTRGSVIIGIQDLGNWMGSSKKASGDHVSKAGPDSPCRKAREEDVNDVFLLGDSAVAVNSFVLKSELQEHWRCPCHRHLKLLKGFFLPSNWRPFFSSSFFSPPPLLLQQAGLELSWGWPEWLDLLPPLLSAEITGIHHQVQIIDGTQGSLPTG